MFQTARQLFPAASPMSVESLETFCCLYISSVCTRFYNNKKHLKNVGPIRHCEPFYIAFHQVSLLSHAATVARRLRIDVHDDDDNDNA